MGLASLERRDAPPVTFQSVWGAGDDLETLRTDYSAMKALKLATVIGCVRRRQALFSQIPFRAYRRDDQGFDLEVSPQPQLLTSPSLFVKPATWKAQMSISRDLWGNAFGRITARDGAGRATSVEWLSPDLVTAIQPNPLSYEIDVRYGGQKIELVDLLLVPSMTLPGTPLGIAPLRHAGLVDLGIEAQKFGADWFKNGAVPSTVVVVDDPEFTEPQAIRLRESIARSWRGRRPAVVGSDIKLESVKVDSNTTSEGFLATARQVQADICQIFGVPAEALSVSTGGGQSITYANREQQTQAELTVSLNADLVLVQECLTALTPNPQYVKADTHELLMSDLLTRYKAHALATGGRAWLEADEVRGIERLRPMTVAQRELLAQTPTRTTLAETDPATTDVAAQPLPEEDKTP